MTVNIAIDALSNSNNCTGFDIFICPPDGNCSDGDSAGEDDPQVHNLFRGQLLAQCELRISTIETDGMVVLDEAENLEKMQSS